jgi:hypothetical protein
MFLNSDGLNYNLLKTLHEEHNKLWCSLDLNLPDTIIFFKSKPSAWFFTNKKGKLKRKMQHNVNEEKIFKLMCRRDKIERKCRRFKNSGIVAYYLSDIKLPNGQEKTQCQYFDKDRLRRLSQLID